MRFKDRSEAGQKLALLLNHYRYKDNIVLLALPPGGVAVAFEIANYLHFPLDVYLVRKLTAPNYEKLTMGVIACGGITVFNSNVLHTLLITPDQLAQIVAQERSELLRYNKLYRDDKPLPNIKNKHIIIVDDGLATGATMLAAVNVLKQCHPAYITVAIPVAPYEACKRIKAVVDELICACTPNLFDSIRAWYIDFSPVSDEKIIALLSQSADYSAPV